MQHRLSLSTRAPACLALALALTLALGVGCAGVVGEPGSQPGPDQGTGGAAAINDGPLRLPPASACTDNSPGPRALRRLTAQQYADTVRDLFGDASVPAASVFDDPIVLGFSHDTGTLVVQGLTGQQLMDHAEAVAHWAVTTHLPQIASCNTPDAACRGTVIREFGKRAFRAPLTDARVQAYDAIFAAEATFQDGVEAMVAAMLQSPYFLYRRELGQPDGANPGAFVLSPYEVATNLAYLLTGSMPDDQLLAAADSGALATRDGLDREAQRLLAAPKSQDAIMTFMTGWLQLGRLTTTVKDDTVFKLTDTLRQEMQAETRALIIDTVFTRNGTVGDLLTAGYSFINRDLALYYGIGGDTGSLNDQFQQFSYPAGSRDPGILAHGTILVGHATAATSSPVQRGKLVRTRLLCQDMPPPPANLDTKLKPPTHTETTRQHFEEHDASAVCSSCHRFLDPVGFTFEHYDGFGRRREQENGISIDATGTILSMDPAAQADVPVEGIAGLAGYLASNPDVNRCLVRYWSYFAYGSASWPQDGCTYDAVAQDAANDQFRMRAVLMGIIHAPRFSRRVKD